MHCHSEIIGISNEATVKDFRKAAVNFMKGYFVTDGYMGLVDGVYRLFADESDYYEYISLSGKAERKTPRREAS